MQQFVQHERSEDNHSVYIFVYKILGYHMNLVSIFICRGPWKTYELGMLPLPFPYGGVDIQVDIY